MLTVQNRLKWVGRAFIRDDCIHSMLSYLVVQDTMENEKYNTLRKRRIEILFLCNADSFPFVVSLLPKRNGPGSRSSKDPVYYRAWKAILATMIRLPWKAALLTCFRYKERQNNSVPSFKGWNVFLLKIQRDLCHSKSFGTFEKRAPLKLNSWEGFGI